MSTLRFASDEVFDHDILRAWLRRATDVDILTIQQAGLRGLPDPNVLAWAAGEGRILLTHDAKTMTGHAYARVADGLPMPGLVVIAQTVPIRDAVEALMLFDGASQAGEWEGQVVRLPIQADAFSMEHEDRLVSMNEGFERAVEFLKGVVFQETPGAMWWA